MPDPRVEFERIASEVVERAGRVRCTREQFIEGLEFIEQHVREAAEAAREFGS